MMVADPDAHKKLWVDVLGGEVVHVGALEMYKFPGVYIIAGKARTPGEGSDGSTINHFGFSVKSYAETKAKLTGAHIELATDNTATKQIVALFPDKIRVEFTEDAALKMPIAFHHIHLSSPDGEKMRDWYVKVFGARSGMRGAFQAAFVPGGEVDFRKSAQADAPSKGRALDHIGFEVRGLEEFCKKLEADGVKLEVPYRVVPQLDGLKIAFLIDPEGTRIELTEGLAGR